MTLLGGAAAAWPAIADAQQPVIPVVGFLNSLGQNERPNLRDAFRRGLSEVGFVEGRNVAIEYRFAEGHPDRLPPRRQRRRYHFGLSLEHGTSGLR
jgi:putative ABC transport system substrate-binding protein